MSASGWLGGSTPRHKERPLRICQTDWRSRTPWRRHHAARPRRVRGPAAHRRRAASACSVKAGRAEHQIKGVWSTPSWSASSKVEAAASLLRRHRSRQANNSMAPAGESGGSAGVSLAPFLCGARRFGLPACGFCRGRRCGPVLGSQEATGFWLCAVLGPARAAPDRGRVSDGAASWRGSSAVANGWGGGGLVWWGCIPEGRVPSGAPPRARWAWSQPP